MPQYMLKMPPKKSAKRRPEISSGQFGVGNRSEVDVLELKELEIVEDERVAHVVVVVVITVGVRAQV
jgi:hypothetical protein